MPATVRILIDLGKLDTPSGQIIVSAAVFDDILSLVLLAWLTALMETEPGAAFEFGPIVLKVAVFFAITSAIGVFIFPLGGRKTIGDEGYDDVRNKTSAMTFGFLAPIFFASVGLNMDFVALTEVPIFVGALVLIAFIGKFVGAGVAATTVGLSRRDSAVVGVGMSARGAVELVIADIALEAGLFEVVGEPAPVIEHLFSAVVIMAVVTTLATPVLLKWIYSN